MIDGIVEKLTILIYRVCKITKSYRTIHYIVEKLTIDYEVSYRMIDNCRGISRLA